MHARAKLIAVLVGLIGLALCFLAAAVRHRCIPPGSAATDRSGEAAAASSRPAPQATQPAEGWYMHRGGPALLGVAVGELPDSFKPLWRFKTDGAVASSAAIVGGRVFIGSDDGNVYALALTDGKRIWAFQTGDAVEAAPLVLPGSVYVGSGDQHLYRIDAATGREVWRYKTGGKILGSANWFGSPTGSTWILVGSYDNKLHCVDAATGQAVWTYETESFINGAPAVAVGKAVFGGCDARVHVVSIADGSSSGAVEAGSYIAASAAIAGGHAFVGNYGGGFLCVDLGARTIVWTYEDKEAAFFSSPAVGRDRVVLGSRDRRVHCVRREDGRAIWTFPTRGWVDSSPVICADKVVVGSDDGRLYVLALADGRQIWSYELGDAVASSPAVLGGRIVIGCGDGYVYAFGPG